MRRLRETFGRYMALPKPARICVGVLVLYAFAIGEGMQAVYANLYLLRLGYGPAVIGQVNAMASIAFATLSIPAGALSRRWGARRSLRLALSLCLAFALWPVAELMVSPWREGWLFGMTFLGWGGGALLLVSTLPLLIGSTPKPERAFVISMRMGIGLLAGFVGSLVGGLLPSVTATVLGTTTADVAAYRYPMILAPAIALLGLFFVRQMPDEPVLPEEQVVPLEAAPGRVKVWPVIVAMAAVMAARTAAVAAGRVFFSVYMDDELGVATASLGGLLALVQLLTLPVVLRTPRYVRRVGMSRWITGSIMGVALSMVPLALAPHWFAAFLGRAGLNIFAYTIDTAMSTYQMELVPAAWRSTMSGAVNAAIGASFMAVTLGGGYMIAAIGYQPLFALGGAVAVFGALGFWAYFRVPRGEFAHNDPSRP